MQGPCMIFPGFKDRDGYGRISIRGKGYGAHVLALMLALGRRLKEGKYALHRCHNPSCMNPTHLYEGTPKDNMRDAWERGSLSAEKLSHARSRAVKYTAQQVAEIRARHTAGEPISRIALEMKIGRGTVWRIATGRSRART